MDAEPEALDLVPGALSNCPLGLSVFGTVSRASTPLVLLLGRGLAQFRQIDGARGDPPLARFLASWSGVSWATPPDLALRFLERGPVAAAAFMRAAAAGLHEMGAQRSKRRCGRAVHGGGGGGDMWGRGLPEERAPEPSLPKGTRETGRSGNSPADSRARKRFSRRRFEARLSVSRVPLPPIQSISDGTEAARRLNWSQASAQGKSCCRAAGGMMSPCEPADLEEWVVRRVKHVDVVFWLSES